MFPVIWRFPSSFLSLHEANTSNIINAPTIFFMVLIFGKIKKKSPIYWTLGILNRIRLAFKPSFSQFTFRLIGGHITRAILIVEFGFASQVHVFAIAFDLHRNR